MFVGKLLIRLFLLFLFLLSSNFCQQLANEFFPDGSASGPNSSNAQPTEEELIQRLLKNPGLPPAAPPSLPEEQPNKEFGNNDEKAGETSRAKPEPSATVNNFKSVQKSAHPPAAPPTYIQCLLQIGAKVCDPNEILNAKERADIDDTLKELEAATRKEKAANECQRSGLELMVIIIRHSSISGDQINTVQSKLNDALGNWVRDPEHKCEKPVILMLSADPQMMNRKVWTGRHWDVPVNPGELVQLFMEQEELTRKEKYGEVILNVIDGMLNRYEKRVLTDS